MEQFYEPPEEHGLTTASERPRTEEEWKERILQKQEEIEKLETELLREKERLQDMKKEAGLKHWVPPLSGSRKTH